ncbi:MAG: quinolinate synthase [Verrucomicrobiales bacterium]|nr:quinolinate synthase [Verrucomicrobiales bacterium]|tara:strand:+ start:195 stop:1196 length:1002 start_codon:yes stop_codon:yes gene_type:complete
MISGTDIEPGGPLVAGVRRPMPRDRFDALSREILELKEQHNAVILAHNYQVPEIQDVADYVGDSLGLSQQAEQTNADVIVFAGVHFMAETAKILSPEKKVVLPDLNAGCSLEEGCPADKLKELQETNPNFWTIAYINCSAAVKGLCDVICTSGNAHKIVSAAPPDRDLLFVPDENLGTWVMEQTGRPMTLWNSNCYVHVEWTHAAISRIRGEYPDAPVVAHPECTKAVRMLADEVCSTEKMVHFCQASSSEAIIIATEAGMLHRLKKECPDKRFIPAPTEKCACNECHFMKMNTLEKLRDCMKHLTPEVELDPKLIERARLPIQRMLEISARP